MPVRPRRTRRAKNALTLSRFLDLMIGPAPELESVFREHRRRFPGDSWAVQFFEHGRDLWSERPALEIPPDQLPQGMTMRDLQGEPITHADLLGPE